MDRDFGRTNRRALRQLANAAWDRELSNELRTLDASFAAWKTGQLTPHSLSSRIHEFHDGPARDLYVLYTRMHPSQLVARAIARDILAEAEVPQSLLIDLATAINYYRSAPPLPTEDYDDGVGNADSSSPAS